jgi:hypothetical protein
MGDAVEQLLQHSVEVGAPIDEVGKPDGGSAGHVRKYVREVMLSLRAIDSRSNFAKESEVGKRDPALRNRK